MRTIMYALCGLVLLLGVSTVFSSCTSQTPIHTVSSPNRNVRVDFGLDTIGQPFYQVWYDGQFVIQKSDMGFVLTGGKTLNSRFTLVNKTENHVDEVWENYWGQRQYIRNNYSEAVYSLRHDLGTLKVFFRVYDDGLGFRYELEANNGQEITIADESTSFNVAPDAQSWWIPVDDDSYEKFYEHTTVAAIDSIQTPFTLEMSEDLYVCIHEAALIDFPSMTLKKGKNGQLRSRLVPSSKGSVYKGGERVTSPWRTITIGRRAVDLINSNIIENLNEAPQHDFSWVKPLKYMGIWWEMHLGLKSWSPGDKHGATTAHAKEMIDFAAANNMNGLLVEGWNKGWEAWKDFDYCQPYPDYDLEAVVKYGQSKGVDIIIHNETAGYVKEYEKQIPEAFDYYQKLGIKYIKTGYVGPIKNGEPHHGQYMVNHYQYVLEEAAKRGICIMGHEHIKPTGLHRTWPNLLAVESARGQEYNAPWAPENNPVDHTLILPFTRLMGGPMDYTPGLFDLTYAQHGIKDKRAYSTLAHQLALYVVYPGPAQMACDLPQNYTGHPAFEFIKQVPVNWSKSIYLDGEIGQYLVVARKSRENDSWYLGALNGEEERRVEIPLSFLDSNCHYEATLYKDGEMTNWQHNPQGVLIDHQKVDHNSILSLKLAAGGGCAITLMPCKD
ncbi:MAG: glycoside hydrolase family 97 protein [Marinilabiliaceae bacterium]|nr:glycoside hydrolase family 97 protein [Marinilabiliaceae bacterium]